MKTLLIGFPNSGKSTLFSAITEQEISENELLNNNIKTVKIPDKRLNELCTLFNPKKRTPIELLVNDIHINPQMYNKYNSIFYPENKKKFDDAEVICYVIRGFKNPSVAYHKSNINILLEIESLIEEIIITDLVTAEKRRERLIKENKTDIELNTIDKIIACLSENKLIMSENITDDELKSLSGFKFISQKNMLFIINIDDGSDPDDIEKSKQYLENNNLDYVILNAEIEKEIALINPNERQDFLDEYDIDTPISELFLQKLFSNMNLITFFTVGEDEVKAWTVKKNDSAYTAAGKIHSDIQKGFIRAEVMKYDDLIKYGTINELKKEGKIGVQGKNYTVNDGEIIHFRFNV